MDNAAENGDLNVYNSRVRLIHEKMAIVLNMDDLEDIHVEEDFVKHEEGDGTVNQEIWDES